MSADSSASGAVSDRSEVVALRDRILAAFLADRATILIERDDTRASLRVRSGAQVILLACPADASPSTLRPVLDAIVRGATAEITHLVVIGGDRKVARELKRSAPFWQLRLRFGFHHVNPSGDVRRVNGLVLRELEQVVARASGMAPVADDAIALRLEEDRQRNIEEARLDTTLRRGFPWVTAALCAVCVALFVLGHYWAQGNFSAALFRMGANSGDEIKEGEVWRLLASAFLHGNVEHIVVNMLALASFGPVLERLLGPRRFIVLYALSGLGGALASALLRGPGMSVGASGAIWGLMAAGVGLALRPSGLLPPLRLEQARRRAAIPLVVNIIYSFFPGIDLLAHFGGGLVGFALMLTGIITRGVTPASTEGMQAAQQPRSSSGLTLVALALSIAMIGSVAAALATGRPWQIGEPPVLTRVQVADTGVTLEIPSVMAGALVDEHQDGVRILRYGKLSEYPLIVELLIVGLAQVVPPEQLEEVLETERKALQEVAIPGAQRQTDAVLATQGGRRFATVTHRINTVTLRTWLTIVGDRELILRIYALDELPSSWLGLEEKIVASLQAQ
jgi:membrane associated rhomboid family serine protease